MTIRYISLFLVFFLVLHTVKAGGNLITPPPPSLHTSDLDEPEIFSAYTRDFMRKVTRFQEGKPTASIFDLPPRLKEKHVVLVKDGIPHISGLAKVSNEQTENDLSERGVITNARAGDILALTLPLDALFSLHTVEGLLYFELDDVLENDLELAREMTNTNDVHAGTGLPQEYNGEGVVVGTVDIGFDMSHPTLYDVTGTQFRVKRLYDIVTGSSFLNESEIKNWLYDHDDNSHGSHVSGIASGASPHLNGKLRGAAPASDIIIASTTGHHSRLMDGVAKTFEYADEHDQPAVANLSWGGHNGPHDGTSLFDQGLENLIAPGRILVTSAGNSGNKNLHVSLNPPSTDAEMRTFIRFDNDESYDGDGNVNVWGAEGEDFYVYIDIWHPNGGSPEESTNLVATYGPSYDNTFMLDGQSLEISITTESMNPHNNRSNAYISIDNNTDRIVELVVTGTDKKVHAWNLAGDFTNEFPEIGVQNDRLNGDNDYSIGSNVAGKKIISVAAYHRSGDIASFSSRGPTSDERIKPDITGPGNYVISSINSFDTRYHPGGSREDNVEETVTDGNNSWDYARMSGTSMSAPYVTGVIALMLQVDPVLTYERALELLRENAIQDSHTGNIPPEGNNIWGAGKVDAFASVNNAFPGYCMSFNEYNEIAFTFDDGSGDGENYLPGSNCRFLINPPEGDKIILTFNEFDLDPTDTLFVYDGNSTQDARLGAFTGNSLPGEVISSTNQMLLHFVTTDGNTAGGWQAEYCTTPDFPDISIGYGILVSDVQGDIQWFKDGEELTNERGNDTLQTTGNGYYYAIISNEFGCSTVSDSVHYIYTVLEHPAKEKNTVSKVFPNPVTGKLHLESTERSKINKIKIIDLSGKTHFEKSIDSGKENEILQIDVSGITPGAYLIKVQGNGISESQMIVVE